MAAPKIGEDWVEKLLRLKANWDGYHAEPINLSAIETVKGFSVVPKSDGGVQLETHRDGFDIEIDISSDGRITSALVAKAEPAK
jgi:hypothetical protein